jgi:hypothetical protein
MANLKELRAKLRWNFAEAMRSCEPEEFMAAFDRAFADTVIELIDGPAEPPKRKYTRKAQSNQPPLVSGGILTNGEK